MCIRDRGKEKLACIDCVTDALTKRIEFFAEMGCRASDHGLDYIPYREATKEEAVSYTHLDVYKRQEHLRHLGQHGGTAALAHHVGEAADGGAVSYTHLDVYKRQIPLPVRSS